MSLGKSLIAIILTAAVIFAMAFLPFGVSQLQDQYTHTDYAYADINAVELQMNTGSMWDRLTMLTSGYESLQVSTEQASIAEDELPDYIQEGLQPYIDRGVLPYIPDYTTDINEVDCQMVYEAKTVQPTGFIFWLAVLKDTETGDVLELIVDDQSGKLIFLNYYTTDYFTKTTLTPNDLLHLYLYTYLEEIADEAWQTEVLGPTLGDGMYHTGAIIRHPERTGLMTLSFLAESHGLNMSVSADNFVYDKAYSKN